MEVVLNLPARNSRITLLGAVALAITAAAPTAAHAAANNVCSGSITKAPLKEGDEPGSFRAAFTLGCQDPVTAFSLITDRTVEVFDTDLQVFMPSGALNDKEAFQCSGDIPGHGVNCSGNSAGGYEQIRGSFGTADSLCGLPRASTQLVVSYAAADSKGKVSNALAGPFDLGPPKGCPRPRKRKPHRHPRNHRN